MANLHVVIDGARPRGRDERGIAIVMVIWLLAVLSLIAASFLAEARVEVRRAGNLLARAQAEALADAGIQLAIARLMHNGWAEAPAPWSQSLTGGSVNITVSDERGKIDLNGAGHDLLSGLFKSRGLSPAEASALASAVIDFRDPDHNAQVDGAEDPTYEAEGLADGAKDAPFQSVSELAQVRGFTPDLVTAVAALVTVQTGATAVDPLRADPMVLAAIPGIDRRELDRFLKLRAEMQNSSPALLASSASTESRKAAAEAMRARLLQALPALNGVGRYFVATDGIAPTFLIEADARMAGGGHFVRRAIVRPAPQPIQPFQLLAWERPPSPD